MIINSIRNIWDMVGDRYRKTVYRIVEDPVSNKTYIETERYLYDKTGTVKQNDTGNNIDKKV
jgi:hypothetical protein